MALAYPGRRRIDPRGGIDVLASGGRALSLAGLLLLGGCSALSEEQCRAGDWYQLGYQDGQQGRTRQRLQEYTKACQEYRIQPDGLRWQEGYERGLEGYCQPQLAYSKGRAGQPYRGVCPDDASFRAEYQRGRAVYELHREVSRLEKALAQLHEEQDQLWHHYRHADDPRERAELRHRLRRLEWDEHELRHSLADARQEAAARD